MIICRKDPEIWNFMRTKIAEIVVEMRSDFSLPPKIPTSCQMLIWIMLWTILKNEGWLAEDVCERKLIVGYCERALKLHEIPLGIYICILYLFNVIQ